MLKDLKHAFWPFQLNHTRSLFLRAAQAAHCSNGSNNTKERFLLYNLYLVYFLRIICHIRILFFFSYYSLSHTSQARTLSDAVLWRLHLPRLLSIGCNEVFGPVFVLGIWDVHYLVYEWSGLVPLSPCFIINFIKGT